MAEFTPTKHTAEEFNGGVKYINKLNSPDADSYNALIENDLYQQEKIENLYDTQSSQQTQIDNLEVVYGTEKGTIVTVGGEVQATFDADTKADKSDLANFVNNVQAVEEESENILLTDTTDGYVDKITIKGNTTGGGGTGKNLWFSEITNLTNDGITFTYDNTTQEFTVNGTSTGDAVFDIANVNYYTAGKTFTQTIFPISGTADALYVLSRTSSYTLILCSLTNLSTTATLDENITVLRIYIPSGFTANNYKFKVQLEEGSTATEYEEYRETTPFVNMPSNFDIVSTGKNLFDINQDYIYKEKTTTVTVDGNKLILENTSSSSTFPYVRYNIVNLIYGTTYTIKCDFEVENDGGNSNRLLIFSLKNDTYNYCGSISKSGNSFTFTYNSDYDAISLSFYTSGAVGVAGKTTYSNIQLEVGSTATNYEEYKEQTTSIDLYDTNYNYVELNSIGDLRDYIDHNGVYHKNIAHFTGSDIDRVLINSSQENDTSIYFEVFFYNYAYNYGNNIISCNMLKNQGIFSSSIFEEGINYEGTPTTKSLRMRLKKERFGDGTISNSTVLSYLRNSNIDIMIGLNTPETKQMSNEYIEAIGSIKTYDGQTNIYTNVTDGTNHPILFVGDIPERNFYKRVEFVDKSGDVLYGKTTDEQVIMNSGKSLSTEVAEIDKNISYLYNSINNVKNLTENAERVKDTDVEYIYKVIDSSDGKNGTLSIPYGLDLSKDYVCTITAMSNYNATGDNKNQGQKLKLYNTQYNYKNTLVGGAVVPFFDYINNIMKTMSISLVASEEDDKIYYDINTDYTGNYVITITNFKELDSPFS